MKKRILLVDDETTVLQVYGQMLRNFGYEVDAVDNKEQAETLLRKKKYSAAIFDLQLSNLEIQEGLELSSLACRLQRDIRIILITAYGRSDIKSMAINSGVHCYLEKPVSTKVILDSLRELKN